MHPFGQRGFLRVIVLTNTWVDSLDELKSNGQLGEGRCVDVVPIIHCGVTAIPFQASPEPVYWFYERCWVWPWVK